MKLSKKMSDQDNLRSGICHTIILRLTTRTRDNRLFLRTQRYRISTKKNRVSIRRTPCFNTTIPISIRITKDARFVRISKR